MTNLLVVLFVTNWISVPGDLKTEGGTNYAHAYRIVSAHTNYATVTLCTNILATVGIGQVSSNAVPEWIPSVTPPQWPPLPVLPSPPYQYWNPGIYLTNATPPGGWIVPNVQVKQ